MRFLHTADWHLGKLVQGVYMTEDQEYILEQFTRAVEREKPDAVIVAGDLYDRAIPPTEAVHLLNDVLEKIVLDLKTPVLAIAGNHDSPSRLNFGSKIMEDNGLYMTGNLTADLQPVVLHDDYGEVHFYLVPYTDPSVVRNVFNDDTIRTHHDAAEAIVNRIKANMDPNARHVFVGHAFVTQFGEEEENTSDSERPLAIGGAEHVDAALYTNFHYTALGHLHQGHYVLNETICYPGSILKYSISEEHHKKGFHIVDMDRSGNISLEKQEFTPKRDMRTIKAAMDELLTYPVNEDYVFVRLLDETPVLSPMEKIRSVYPNAMHVTRENYLLSPAAASSEKETESRRSRSQTELFHAFYEEVKGEPPKEETEAIFNEVLNELLTEENEITQEGKPVSKTN